MEIYNDLGWALVLVPPIVAIWERDISYLLDIRPILAIIWGIFLIWRV